MAVKVVSVFFALVVAATLSGCQTQLYPRPRKKSQFDRRWRVDYKLTFDGGKVEWSGYYHFKILALIATFWNVHVSSWGGTAFLYDQKENFKLDGNVID